MSGTELLSKWENQSSSWLAKLDTLETLADRLLQAAESKTYD